MGIQFGLRVPGDMIALPVVRSFVSEAAALAGFDRNMLGRFALIAEEAFVYILRTSLGDEEDIDLEIVTRVEEVDFFVSFMDKGLPFGGRVVDDDDISRLQLNIIKSNCDKLEWINRGKNGKELRIKFVRPKRDITQYKLIAPITEKPPSDDIVIELLKPEDAYKVSQIIYKTYGYTYPNEDMYYPEIIENLNREGKLISLVAIDRAYDRIVGHYAIERYAMGDVAELGQAVVDPAYRGKGILVKMREKLEETARGLGIKGLYSQPVTSHTRTQSVNEKFGSKPCGISFGLVPREFNYKKMEKIKPLNERETCFMYFKPLLFEDRQVYIPSEHSGIIKEIYEVLGFKINELKGKECSGESVIDAKYNASWGFCTINVMKVGSDLAPRVKSVFTQLRLSTQAEVIFLNIPMSDCSLDAYMEMIESLGFFFCGIVPYAVGGKDIIRFQYLNTSVDVSRIKIYGDFAKRIFDYSVTMMKRALGI